VKKNALVMSQAFTQKGYHVISEGTDNHLMLIDLRSKGRITGRDAEDALIKADITINKNMVPFDDQSPFVTSGMRVGTAAVTTRGMKEDDMKKIVDLIDGVLANKDDNNKIKAIRDEVNHWMKQFPLYLK
jgi:glycine hydroxymethyltransferase